MVQGSYWADSAAVFGASGGIGAALARELAGRGCTAVHAGSRSGEVPEHEAIRPFRFDLTDQSSIAEACENWRDAPPKLVIVATGVLTLSEGKGPERSYKAIDPQDMAQVLALNTIGPALIAKHALGLLPREGRSVFAAISAKVGSIEDNRIGGWHSYRASKAALDMLVRNYAIELGRTHREAVIAALHPGTVDTALSEPFQSNLPEGQLTSPADAARNLLDVLDGLTPEDSGGLFAWDGERLPY